MNEIIISGALRRLRVKTQQPSWREDTTAFKYRDIVRSKTIPVQRLKMHFIYYKTNVFSIILILELITN